MAVIVMGHMQYTGNGMFPGEKSSGFTMQNGGIVPPSLLQESRVPRFYKEAIAKCGASSQSQLPNTALVYNLMITSCLPRAILGNIWSLVNRTIPGQLTRQEFFSCLALIALIQKGQPLSALSAMSTLPIPHLQACAAFAHHLPTADIFQQQEFCQTVQKAHDSSGVLINLPTMATTSSTVSLLADIDFSKPANISSNFAEPTSVSVTQIPTSQPYPSVSTLHVNGTNVATSVPVTISLSHSSNLSTGVDNRVLSNGTQSVANISPNSGLPNGIPDIAPRMLRSSSQIPFSQMASFSSVSSTNVGADKAAGTLEPAGGPDIYTTIKLMADANKDGEDECLYVWRRCIEEAYALLNDADSLFLCSPLSHIKEVIHTDRGTRYINALYEIYEMTLRIREGRMDQLVKQREMLEKIDRIWTQLKSFIESNKKTVLFTESISETTPLLCSICLLNVSSNSILEFTGNIYHKQCANLWINRVDSLLPKLKRQ